MFNITNTIISIKHDNRDCVVGSNTKQKACKAYTFKCTHEDCWRPLHLNYVLLNVNWQILYLSQLVLILEIIISVVTIQHYYCYVTVFKVTFSKSIIAFLFLFIGYVWINVCQSFLFLEHFFYLSIIKKFKLYQKQSSKILIKLKKSINYAQILVAITISNIYIK